MSVAGMIAIGNGEKCPFCNEILYENQEIHLFEKHKEETFAKLFPKDEVQE